MSLALSKTLDPADFAELAEELAIVDTHFTSAREQHPMRRWEYAMALRAVREWQPAYTPVNVYDVGGAGSPFSAMCGSLMIGDPIVVDPDVEPHKGYRTPLAEFVRGGARLAQAVFCLSVMEHVDDLDQFLYHLSCLVAPGGLLFLTGDYCDGYYTAKDDAGVPDHYHFHWMRKRIFNAYSWGMIAGILHRHSFVHLGGVDVAWHGPQVYDYTFASLALVKRA